jgi:hypothetical protein
MCALSFARIPALIPDGPELPGGGNVNCERILQNCSQFQSNAAATPTQCAAVPGLPERQKYEG